MKQLNQTSLLYTSLQRVYKQTKCDPSSIMTYLPTTVRRWSSYTSFLPKELFMMPVSTTAFTWIILKPYTGSPFRKLAYKEFTWWQWFSPWSKMLEAGMRRPRASGESKGVKAETAQNSSPPDTELADLPDRLSKIASSTTTWCFGVNLRTLKKC